MLSCFLACFCWYNSVFPNISQGHKVKVSKCLKFEKCHVIVIPIFRQNDFSLRYLSKGKGGVLTVSLHFSLRCLLKGKGGA